MNFKYSIEVADKLLKEQQIDFDFSTLDLEGLHARAVEHVNKYFTDEIREIVPFDERGFGALLFLYVTCRKLPNENTSLSVPYGPTTINIDKGNLPHIFQYFNTFEEFVEFAPEVKYYNNVTQLVDIEGKDYKIPLVDALDKDFQSSMYMYTGCWLHMEDFFAECKDKRSEYDEDQAIISIKNEEVKALVLELNPGLLTKHLTLTHTYIDEKEHKISDRIGVYDLFLGTIRGVDVSFVRCYCPTTDRMFLLETEVGHTTAQDAIASLCRFPSVLRDRIKEVRRNGEVFHFTTDEGVIEEIKEGKYSEEDLNNLNAYFTGEEYFSLLKFEC